MFIRGQLCISIMIVIVVFFFDDFYISDAKYLLDVKSHALNNFEKMQNKSSTVCNPTVTAYIAPISSWCGTTFCLV